MKAITAQQAAQLIEDGATIGVGGMGLSGWAEEIAAAIEESFLSTGHPRSLKLKQGSFIGDGADRGVVHFAHRGLLSSWTVGIVGFDTPLSQLIAEGALECHCLPQGVIINLWREIAAGRPGLITKVGLGTFVDPEVEGGCMGNYCSEQLVESIELHGERYLLYRSFPVDVAIIRGTYADADGNISFWHESVMNEGLALAAAAKASNGIVIVQVERIIERGSIRPSGVRIPGILVDYVVEATDERASWQTEGSFYNEAFCERSNNEKVEFPKVPLDVRKLIARRAACELRSGDLVNVGVGIPAAIALVCAEEGVVDAITFTSEAGSIGGAPAPKPNFGSAFYPQALIDAGSMFDMIDGGIIDITFLGIAQVDAEGNVDVSKFAHRVNGPGGLINLAGSCGRVVFCGTFSAGAYEEVVDGKMHIAKQGRAPKFVEHVEQITFAAHEALARGQSVLYITDRAVFKLTENGLMLTEIAPGIDLQADVLDQMGFVPVIAEDLKLMDEAIFHEIWGGLSIGE